MKLVDHKIIYYQDALHACRRRQIAGNMELTKDIQFFNKKLKQLKQERKRS